MGFRILTSKRRANLLELLWEISIGSRKRGIGRGSAGAAHRHSCFDTNVLDRVSKIGREHRRLYVSVPLLSCLTLLRNDLKMRFSLGDTLLRRISENVTTVMMEEEASIAFKTPRTEGGLTKVPKTAGWWLIKSEGHSG